MKETPEKVKREIIKLKRKGFTVSDIIEGLKISDFTV
jgi:hypothetical protein